MSSTYEAMLLGNAIGNTATGLATALLGTPVDRATRDALRAADEAEAEASASYDAWVQSMYEWKALAEETVDDLLIEQGISSARGIEAKARQLVIQNIINRGLIAEEEVRTLEVAAKVKVENDFPKAVERIRKSEELQALRANSN
jgi:hypothetical protein